MMNHKQATKLFLAIVIVVLMCSMVFAATRSCATGRTTTSKGCEASTQTNHGRMTAEVGAHGRVAYNEDIRSNLSTSDLAVGIDIEHKRINVNSEIYTELNEEATIYFYDTGLEGNVVIFRDGVQCAGCVPVLYGDDDYYLDVEHFSEYVIAGTEFNGTFISTSLDKDGFIRKSGDIVFGVGFSNEINSSGTGVQEVSEYNVTGTINNDVYYDPLAGLNSTGSYVFDGVDDGILFPAHSQYSLDLQNGFTLIARISVFQPNGGGGSAESIVGYWGGINDRNTPSWLNGNSALATRLTNGTATSTLSRYQELIQNNYSFLATMSDQTNFNYTQWVQNRYSAHDEFESSTFPLEQISQTKSMCVGASGISCNADEMNGTISHLQLFNRTLTPEEVQEIAFSFKPKVYLENNNYTSEVFNLSDYTAEVDGYNQIINNISINGTSNFLEVYILDSSNNWINGTKNGEDYIFGTMITNEESQIRISFLGEWNYTDKVFNYSINAESVSSLAGVPQCTIPYATPGEYCFEFAGTVTGCSTYDLYNATELILDDGFMLPLGDDVYSFPFNQSEEGTYLAKFCDGNEKEIKVKEDDNMPVALVLTIGLFVGSMFYMGFKLDEEHFILRMFNIFFALIALIIAATVSITGTAAAGVTFLKLPLAFFSFFVVYFGLYLFFHMTRMGRDMLKKINRGKD
jgi:hypothetical protein